MNEEEAREVMRTFADSAYFLYRRNQFEHATRILYGKEFNIKVDRNGRMQFLCTVCNKEMNNENSMAEHSFSGAHQKNVDKLSFSDTRLVSPGCDTQLPVVVPYTKGTLQCMLYESNCKAIGLQLVEEYALNHRKTCYRCNCCGTHGLKEAMYRHLIGPKHTEKYLTIRLSVPPKVMDAQDREAYRRYVIEHETQRIDKIGYYTGLMYYPYRLARKQQGYRYEERPMNQENYRYEKKSKKHQRLLTGANLFEIEGERHFGLSNVAKAHTSGVDIACQTEGGRPDYATVMAQLHYIIQICDVPEGQKEYVTGFETPEEYSISLNILFHLAASLYRHVSIRMRNADETVQEHLGNSKENISKVLERLQTNLIPADKKALEYLKTHS